MSAFAAYLTDEEIAKVRNAIIEAGLATHPAQDAMIAGILPVFAGMLPAAAAPIVRLQTQLTLINRVPNLRNGDVPLAQYLAAAVALASAQPAADTLEVALAKVNNARTGSTPRAASVIADADLNRDVSPEAYASGIDGTLSVKFLRSGAQAAESVVKLRASAL